MDTPKEAMQVLRLCLDTPKEKAMQVQRLHLDTPEVKPCQYRDCLDTPKEVMHRDQVGFDLIQISS